MTGHRRGLVVLASFGAGWVLHAWRCRIRDDETRIDLVRANLTLREYVDMLEGELADRERINAELKDKIDDAFEFGRLIEHEHGGGS